MRVIGESDTMQEFLDPDEDADGQDNNDKVSYDHIKLQL